MAGGVPSAFKKDLFGVSEYSPRGIETPLQRVEACGGDTVETYLGVKDARLGSSSAVKSFPLPPPWHARSLPPSCPLPREGIEPPLSRVGGPGRGHGREAGGKLLESGPGHRQRRRVRHNCGWGGECKESAKSV